MDMDNSLNLKHLKAAATQAPSLMNVLRVQRDSDSLIVPSPRRPIPPTSHPAELPAKAPSSRSTAHAPKQRGENRTRLGETQHPRNAEVDDTVDGRDEHGERQRAEAGRLC